MLISDLEGKNIQELYLIAREYIELYSYSWDVHGFSISYVNFFLLDIFLIIYVILMLLFPNHINFNNYILLLCIPSFIFLDKFITDKRKKYLSIKLNISKIKIRLFGFVIIWLSIPLAFVLFLIIKNI